MPGSQEAYLLRVAALAWVAVTRSEPVDAEDTAGRRAWLKLARAARAYTKRVVVVGA